MVSLRAAALCFATCFRQIVAEAMLRHLPPQLQAAFRSMSKHACPGYGWSPLRESPLQRGIGADHAQVRDYVRWVQKLPGSPTICEIGFNCGHSTATFLEANPRSRVINFDMIDQINFPWGMRAKGWLKREYGNRFVLVEGDSNVTVPAFFACNPSVRCDLAVVDGAHGHMHPLLDIVELVQASRCNTSVIADELCDPALCKPHAPRKGGGGQAEVATFLGTAHAWREANAQGYIAEYETHFGLSANEGWGIARVQCKDGAVKPRGHAQHFTTASAIEPSDRVKPRSSQAILDQSRLQEEAALVMERRNQEAARWYWDSPLPAHASAARATPPDCSILRIDTR